MRQGSKQDRDQAPLRQLADAFRQAAGLVQVLAILGALASTLLCLLVGNYLGIIVALVGGVVTAWIGGLLLQWFGAMAVSQAESESHLRVLAESAARRDFNEDMERPA